MSFVRSVTTDPHRETRVATAGWDSATAWSRPEGLGDGFDLEAALAAAGPRHGRTLVLVEVNRLTSAREQLGSLTADDMSGAILTRLDAVVGDDTLVVRLGETRFGVLAPVDEATG